MTITMKRFALTLLTSTLLLSGSLLADDLQRLAGKWAVTKTSDDGQKYTQIIEIKNDKLTFKVLGEDKSLRLYAEGSIKLEKLGPFNVMKVSDIRGGPNENDLSPVDDDRTLIYQLGYDTWTIASNFDKQRDEKPSVDVYRRQSS